MSISDQNLTFLGGEQLPVLTTGRYLRIREATSPIYITINGGGEIKREKGEQIDLGENYGQLRLGVRSVVAQVVNLVSAENSQSDNRNSVSVTASATVESGNDNQHLAKVTIAAASSAQLAPANAARKSLRVSLLSSAPTFICIGKSGIAAGQGGTLEEGMVDYIDTTGALFGYNPSAASVDVYVMEINKL